MTQALINFFGQFGLSGEVVAFITSMLPIVELRGGIVIARLMAVSFPMAFLVCFIGNMIPIPFILLFIRKIFTFLRKWKPFAKLVDWLEARAAKKSANVQRNRMLGLFLFVAIPIPGTGAWMGALVANLLGIEIKRSLPTIALGVITAGVIMSVLSYWVPGLFGFTV